MARRKKSAQPRRQPTVGRDPISYRVTRVKRPRPPTTVTVYSKLGPKYGSLYTADPRVDRQAVRSREARRLKVALVEQTKAVLQSRSRIPSLVSPTLKAIDPRTRVCVARKQRRESLFAKFGGGRIKITSKHFQRTPNSKVRC